jgi:type VI secretion system secreted protein Hcp
MKLGDIKGEATDANHLEWSVAHSVAFEVDRSGGTNSDATFGDLVCVKLLDKSSPKLMEACAKGTFFPEATFDLTRTLPGGEERPYLRYKLNDVLVTSYSLGGGSDSNDIPTEEVSFVYEEIKVSYRGIRKTYIQYDENGDLVEVVSVGLAARLGGTPPPPVSNPIDGEQSPTADENTLHDENDAAGEADAKD